MMIMGLEYSYLVTSINYDIFLYDIIYRYIMIMELESLMIYDSGFFLVDYWIDDYEYLWIVHFSPYG